MQMLFVSWKQDISVAVSMLYERGAAETSSTLNKQEGTAGSGAFFCFFVSSLSLVFLPVSFQQIFLIFLRYLAPDEMRKMI
jgi:hypothetical protein